MAVHKSKKEISSKQMNNLYKGAKSQTFIR